MRCFESMDDFVDPEDLEEAETENEEAENEDADEEDVDAEDEDEEDREDFGDTFEGVNPPPNGMFLLCWELT